MHKKSQQAGDGRVFHQYLLGATSPSRRLTEETVSDGLPAVRLVMSLGRYQCLCTLGCLMDGSTLGVEEGSSGSRELPQGWLGCVSPANPNLYSPLHGCPRGRRVQEERMVVLTTQGWKPQMLGHGGCISVRSVTHSDI